MSIYDSSYCGSIWHHGIKGQKWGVRRTPEQLGRKANNTSSVAKLSERVTIVDDTYLSSKGFTIAVAKIGKFLLDPGKKHSKEFFDVGYTPSDSEKLFKHIEAGYDLNKKTGMRKSDRGDDQFSIPMELGVTARRIFNTAWQIDKGASKPKLVSAYLDRRVKEDD